MLNMDLDKIAFDLINYWNAIKSMYVDGYNNSEKYALFQCPGINVFNLLFNDIHKKISMSNEENYKRYLYKLKNSTEKHPQFIFRNPLNLELWDINNGNDVFLTKNPQIINFVYINLKRKLEF